MRAGPPASSARTETATKLAEGPINTRCSVPICQTRLACSAISPPATIKAANTAHCR